MQVNALEQLSSRLHRLQSRLGSALSASSNAADQPLAEEDPLVQAALECEFMLPPAPTVRSLSETVEKKIKTVELLLERARQHEDLPETAQVVAGQEYTATTEDYLAGKDQRRTGGRRGAPS